MKGFPDLPPVWWLGSIAAIYLFAWIAPGLHWNVWWIEALSWLLFVAALGVIGWSAWWFYVRKTPIEPHHTPRTLIVDGPYRHSGNPIYLALVTLTLASALGHGSWLGLALAAALWWVLDRRFAAPEEALLRATFGAEAEAYIARTGRWL